MIRVICVIGAQPNYMKMDPILREMASIPRYSRRFCWDEFREADLSRVRRLMRAPLLFDGRNVYSPEVMREQGFVYYGVGRPAASVGSVPARWELN